MSKGNLKLSLNLSQQLKITPQLKQAIKMLQMSRTDLEEEISKELNENPLLERDEEAYTKESTSNKNEDVNWEEYFKNQSQGPRSSSFSENKESVDYDKFNSKPQSLYDYLSWQIGCTLFNEEEKPIAQALIGLVDDKGYIEEGSFNQLCKEQNWDLEFAKEVLEILQEELDPVGVGAFNLQECLLIQAKHFYKKDYTDLKEIITNHLKDLENQNFPLISKALNLDLEPTKALCQIIKGLNPKPGSMFATEKINYVIPDVFVEKIDGKYQILFNNKGVSGLRISHQYKKLILSDSLDEKTKNYIQEKLKSASWFQKAIDQRKKTIYKVVESILKFQKDFFEKGGESLKPMILKDVAKDIDMHESTVSRVTNNKYVHTSHGVFELKYFFNSKISSGDSEAGSHAVKEKIKKIVSQEDPKKPFSDQKIHDILRQLGLKVARRTVSKYRQALGILPATKRKSL